MSPLRFAAAVLIAALAHPAAACLNDSEIPHAESEFRARYAMAPESRRLAPTLIALGAALGAAGVVWWWRARGG
jgi:hypothetical protein